MRERRAGADLGAFKLYACAPDVDCRLTTPRGRAGADLGESTGESGPNDEIEDEYDLHSRFVRDDHQSAVAVGRFGEARFLALRD